MKVFWTLDGDNVSLTAEAPDGAMHMGLGYMADHDDYIETISWDTEEYQTRRHGWLPFPNKSSRLWYVREDLTWRVYRVGTKIYE